MNIHLARTRQVACRALGVILAFLTAAVVLATSAFASGAMTLTFVRHGESQANHDGIINTKVPGPGLTPTGVDQAWAVAYALRANDYDGVYASTMIRTQQTAAPLAGLLGEDVVVLDGLREIDAGIVEGSSEDAGLGRIGYALPPALWTLGARFVPMLGSTDRSGTVFDDRVDTAVQTIYDSGDRNAVAFAHGATIMFWVLMNVDNPDLGLLLTHRLDNTATVQIAGTPESGWTLVDWDGIAVDPEPSFFTKLFVDFRDWITVPQTGLHNVGEAIRTGSITGIARAIGRGLVDIVVATVRFGAAVAGDVIDLVRDIFTGSSAHPAVVQRSRNPVTDTMPRRSADSVADLQADSVVAATAEAGDTGREPAFAAHPGRSDQPDAGQLPSPVSAIADPGTALSPQQATDETDIVESGHDEPETAEPDNTSEQVSHTTDTADEAPAASAPALDDDRDDSPSVTERDADPATGPEPDQADRGVTAAAQQEAA